VETINWQFQKVVISIGCYRGSNSHVDSCAGCHKTAKRIIYKTKQSTSRQQQQQRKQYQQQHKTTTGSNKTASNNWQQHNNKQH